MKNKGFTLVELLAAMVILAILIMIGVMTVSNVFDNTKENYYTSMENTLNIAGNEFFNDNRQEKPIDDYNFVDIVTLQEHEYLADLMTYDNKEKCDPKSGVFIFNDNDHTGYEVCLICGDHKSKGDYCNGKKMGVIDIEGHINDANGAFYNPLLSYSGTSWINALSIYIHFNLGTEGMKVTEYKIYNANTNAYAGSCTNMSGNKCIKSFSVTGSYYVEAYGTQAGVEGSGKIANRKYFNIKIDNTPPTFSLKDTEPIIELEKDNIIEPYENEVIDINDDNGYKEVKYSLEQYKGDNADGTEKYEAVPGHTDVDIKDKDLKIPANLESGKYKLRVTVTDFAGNKGKCNNCTNKETNEIIFYIKYKIDLQYFDKNDKKHDVGNLWIYTYGLYREEDASGTVTKRLPDKIRVNSNPQDVDWYMNANLVGTVVTSYDTRVSKTGYHILYAREQKMKTGFHASCAKTSAGGKLIYNGEDQTLANIPADEVGKYRLIVYYGNTLISNKGKDARTYTVIAVLNSDYMWNDVPASDAKKARAIRCEILPFQVPKPECINPTYNGSSQKLVTQVDDSGKYAGFGSELAYTLDNTPWGTKVGDYPFKATLNSNKNYSWEGSSNYDFSILSGFNEDNKPCRINPIIISTNFTCTDPTYYGEAQGLINELPTGGEEGIASDGTGAGIAVSDTIQFTDDDDEVSNADIAGPFSRYDTSAEGDLYGITGPGGVHSGNGFGGESIYTIRPLLGTNAGPYHIVFTIVNDNYLFDNNSKTYTKDCKINPDTLDINWSAPFTFEWDDTDKIPSASASYGDDSITLSVVTPQKELGDYTATASCQTASNSTNIANGCSNYVISESTKTHAFDIKDTTIPVCSSRSVSTDGTITATATDNYGFDANKTKSKTKTKSAHKNKTNTVSFTDYSGNTGYCSIYVHYGASAEHCGTESCNCGYRSYSCTGTAVNSTIEGSFKCSMATTKSGCEGNMGCSWTGSNYQCDQCAKTCYYE